MGSDYKVLTTIEQNLYKFATFKNANYIEELKAIKHLPEKEYQQAAKKISKNYNENYLRAETQYANRVAAQHRRWNDIQRMSDEFMYLQFKTREDARVRYKHTLYNNFTALASDPVWKYLYPPVKYAYGCRCFVLQHFQLPDDAEQDLHPCLLCRSHHPVDARPVNLAGSVLHVAPAHLLFDPGETDSLDLAQILRGIVITAVDLHAKLGRMLAAGEGHRCRQSVFVFCWYGVVRLSSLNHQRSRPALVHR